MQEGCSVLFGSCEDVTDYRIIIIIRFLHTTPSNFFSSSITPPIQPPVIPRSKRGSGGEEERERF